ncbi:hypothetical protein QQ045_015345 [Rhodiola kirilowii]
MGPLSKLACTWGASLTRLSRRCHAAVAVNPAAGAPAGRAVVDEFTRFCYQRDLPRAMRAMEAMERSGLYADAVTYSELIKCCLARRAVDDGKRVHRHVCSAGYEPKTFLINILLNMSALIDSYSKWGELRNALGVFNEMVTGDSIVWNSIIGGFAQNNEGVEAMNIFKRMKRAGFVANQASLTSVLRACTSLSLLELGRQVHVHILKVHKNVDLAAHAAEQILKLDPTDVGTYILLSNIYANSQRWDDVASIRKAMQVEGVRKEPGCSWIEVDMRIHCFVLGDKSHPMAGAISVELNQLVQRLRGFGYNPDTNFVLQDVEGEEQREDLLRYHSEKLAIVFGLMSLATGKIIRIRKNLRICGDCHIFAKLVAQVTKRTIVIRDPIRYHHFQDAAEDELEWNTSNCNLFQPNRRLHHHWYVNCYTGFVFTEWLHECVFLEACGYGDLHKATYGKLKCWSEYCVVQQREHLWGLVLRSGVFTISSGACKGEMREKEE